MKPSWKLIFARYHFIIFNVASLLLQGTGHGWSVPLLSMLLSVPLWAIIVTQMCSNWSYYTLLTSLPTYMNNILHFDLQSVRVSDHFSGSKEVFSTQMFSTPYKLNHISFLFFFCFRIIYKKILFTVTVKTDFYNLMSIN